MSVYGYIRVSSKDQKENRQLIALREIGVKSQNIYVDKCSGKDFNRPQYEGIAAAKAQGIKFGRPPLPLPDNFQEVYKAWRNEELTFKQAAEICNMPVGTFYGKTRKFENMVNINSELNL